MSDFRYLDYEGLATYTEQVKGYADGKIVYISDESEIPDPPKEGTLYVIGSEILMDEEIIIGTQTSSTSIWTGKSIDTRLHDGKRIAYYLPYSSVAGNPISLTLELSDEDNTTVQTKVFAYGECQGQKGIPGGCVIRMMYFERVIMNGATASNCWICDGSIVQNNVVYTGTPVSGQVATFEGTSGTIKASGYTIASSVPADAKFTDSTYSFSGIPSGVTVTGPEGSYNVKTIPVVNFRLTSSTATTLTATDNNANLVVNCADGDLFIINVTLSSSPTTPASITQITLGTTSYSIYNCFDLSTNLKLQSSGDHHILCTKYGSNIKLLTYDDFNCISVPKANYASYSNVVYATCSTAADTSSKVATISGNTNFKLVTGAVAYVRFTYANSSRTLSLNVGSTGAKTIRYRSAVYSSTQTTQYPSWTAGDTVQFVYTGTYWDIVAPTIIMNASSSS